ncbi:membrane-binding protein [Pontibacter ruber]|uniref:Membrane-binding protein n=1 Tax=Pontibacter ruber TaxID=1343895 RepID=A0ABW5CU02_9BACT|nr:membrane-binding protein [Pontibacter ruber]
MKINAKYSFYLLLWAIVALPVVSQAAAPASATATAPAGARDIITEIIDVVGLKPRFEIRSANIENAAAVIYNGKRYILYNERFLDAINNAVHTDWAGVSILAHEIGHHLNGHTLSRSGSNHADELEADEFSGFVLRKMGASLDEAQAAINLLSEEEHTPTHPGRSYRLAAISKGWGNADEQLLASNNNARPVQPVTRTEAPAKAQPATRAAATLDSRNVLRKVTFAAAPDEEFYLTRSMQLVHLTEAGPKVIGKLARTNSRQYPFYFESNYIQPLFVTEEGVVVNRRGQEVGYFS